MLTFPGWNSVENAAVYAKAFTYAGWACLFMLGISEILAHVYTTRKETLLAAAGVEATKGVDSAEINRLRQQVENSKKAIEEAKGQIAKATIETEESRRATEEEAQARIEIEKRIASRTITPEDHRRFVGILKPYKGSIVFIGRIGTGVEIKVSVRSRPC